MIHKPDIVIHAASYKYVPLVEANIEIEFSGLRPGEKLYEELLIDDSDTKTDYESITVAKPTNSKIKRDSPRI